MQGGLADIWKENIIKDLERRLLNYKVVGEFLADLKEEFSGGDDETLKVAELKKIKKKIKIIEEFVEEFRKATRGSRYEGQLFIEEFKRGMNGTIQQRLIESECQPGTIEQWYKRITNLDRNWRESRKDKKRLKRRRETGNQAPKQSNNRA